MPYTITKWAFNGQHITNAVTRSLATWPGTLIESGEVRVDFQVEGKPKIAVSEIIVLARTAGRYSPSYWASQMSFTQGKGRLDCGGTRQHRLIGWAGSLKSAQEGICEGNVIDPYRGTGYEIEILPSGPNQTGIFIRNPTWYYHGTSQIHPGRDLIYTLTDPAQADLCRSRAGTATVSFNTFNRVCKQVPGWSGFWDAVWRHEKQHWENGRLELLKPANNLYLATDHCVGHDAQNNYPDFNDCVREEHRRIQNAMRAKAGPEPTGFWNTIPWWHWKSDCKSGSSCSHAFESTDRKF